MRVYKDRAIANHQLLVLFVFVSHDEDADIAYVQESVPSDHKLIIVGIILIKLDKVNSKRILIVISQHKETLVICIINDFL